MEFSFGVFFFTGMYGAGLVSSSVLPSPFGRWLLKMDGKMKLPV